MSGRPDLAYFAKESPHWKQPTLLRDSLAQVIDYALGLELHLDFWKACARGEHDLCYADGGVCCTCGAAPAAAAGSTPESALTGAETEESH